MKSDPVIDAIRAVRQQISASVDHNPQKLVEHYRKLQKRHQDRIVTRTIEKPVAKNETAA